MSPHDADEAIANSRARKVLPLRTEAEVAEMERLGRRAANKRRKVRDQLRKRGVPEHVVADRLERLAFDQLVARYGIEQASALRYAFAPEQPDDTRYRPAHHDSLLHGPARATGQTAAAVKRGRTVRLADYRERDK